MIPIFKYEQDAGIAETVRSSGRLLLASAINPIDIGSEQKEQLKKLLSTFAEANPNQFDLFYLESILASAGWNKNDDVFCKEELWNARYTPVDKKFNYMHNEKDIIGHLTSSKVVDSTGNLLSDDLSLTDLPDCFDIVVGAVLYRAWENAELQERMNQIIADILDDKWCVSMECLFRNFDYAVVTPDGSQKVIARNDQTSFLTKHLRFYGGSGQYDGNRVGRLLRNFTFSGKGLVDNPANPRSHITNTNNYREISAFAGNLVTADELNISNKECDMTIAQEQYDALKAQLDATQSELNQLKSSKAKAVETEIESLKSAVAGLEKEKVELGNKLVATEEVVKAKESSVVALQTKLSEVETKLTEAEDKLKNQELEAVKASRKAALLAKVDEARADILVDKFSSVSEELFNTLLESLPAKCMEDEKMDKEKDKKKDKEKAKADEDESVDTDIDDAKASDDADMSSGGEDTTADLCAKASSWFTDVVLRSTAGKRKKGE